MQTPVVKTFSAQWKIRKKKNQEHPGTIIEAHSYEKNVQLVHLEHPVNNFRTGKFQFEVSSCGQIFRKASLNDMQSSHCKYLSSPT